MSAGNATPLGTRAFDGHGEAKAAQKAHEPSMEEILASIRRIIADDQALPLSSRPLPPLRGEATAGVFELRTAQLEPPLEVATRPAPEPAWHGDEPMPEAQTIVAAAQTETAPPMPVEAPELLAEQPVGGFVDGPPPVEIEDATSPDAAADPAYPNPKVAGAVTRMRIREEPEELVSAETGASVASSFNALSASMLVQSLPSVEDLARDLLRPMLKAWLDDNLPTIVERLVRAEIERVARGGR